jgi:hypothetical protein
VTRLSGRPFVAIGSASSAAGACAAGTGSRFRSRSRACSFAYGDPIFVRAKAAATRTISTACSARWIASPSSRRTSARADQRVAR